MSVDDRLKAGDRPLRKGVDGLSLNEWHATAVGGSLGVLAGRTGNGWAAVLVGLAPLAWPREGRIGIRVLAREPWYALVAVVVGYIAGKRARSAASADS